MSSYTIMKMITKLCVKVIYNTHNRERERERERKRERENKS